MSESIVLPQDLLHDAAAAGQATSRTPSEQIERWARLGRAVEPLLGGSTNGDESDVPMSECVASVGTPEGRRRLREYLSTRPFPHFEPVEASPGLFVRIEEDGSRSTGRFENREFVTVE